MAHQSAYICDAQDLDFLLWHKFKLQNILKHYSSIDRDTVDFLINQARQFAVKELGTSYQLADRQGCQYRSSLDVKIPTVFEKLWDQYQALGWGGMAARDVESQEQLPFLLLHSICEVLFGANPSFMMYSGFGVPMAMMIEDYGDDYLKDIFYKPLMETKWCGCFCVTEPNAGSDVGGIQTRATKIEGNRFSIEGEKIFITAGMHQLTDNMVYLVVARTSNKDSGTTGLSTFLVPKYKLDRPEGAFESNNVSCSRLENKMGLNGCATAALSFGEDGVCEGYLLGKENRGLFQLRNLMNMARVSTGLFGLGMASSAYQNAVRYANDRVQGAMSSQSANRQAKKVSIIQHYDVKRMLMDMKSKVEGCRVLVFKLSYHQTIKQISDDNLISIERKEAFKHKGLYELLTPIVKAYVSDQSWKVAELAIQVYGGHGYIKDHPIEQYARDIKILSIWEGTNYMQSTDLFRDKLAMGKNSKLLNILSVEIEESLAQSSECYPELTSLVDQGLDGIKQLHSSLGEWVEEGEVDLVFSTTTRFLHMMAELIIGWQFLESIIAVENGFNNGEISKRFFDSKIATATYFIKQNVATIPSRCEKLLEKDGTLKLMTADLFIME